MTGALYHKALPELQYPLHLLSKILWLSSAWQPVFQRFIQESWISVDLGSSPADSSRIPKQHQHSPIAPPPAVYPAHHYYVQTRLPCRTLPKHCLNALSLLFVLEIDLLVFSRVCHAMPAARPHPRFDLILGSTSSWQHRCVALTSCSPLPCSHHQFVHNEQGISFLKFKNCFLLQEKLNNNFLLTALSKCRTMIDK